MDPTVKTYPVVTGSDQPSSQPSSTQPMATNEPHLESLPGQFRAIPGGYVSSTTPMSTLSPASKAHHTEDVYPSVFYGGVGPEVMLGKWKLVRSVNFDNYLKALGVNIVKRNMMSMEDYCVHFEKVGEETYKMTTATTMKKIELTFKLDGHEIVEHTDDGRKVLTKMTWDNGTLTQKRFATDEDEKGGIVVRIFKGNEMELIAQVDDVICKRFYVRDENCM